MTPQRWTPVLVSVLLQLFTLSTRSEVDLDVALSVLPESPIAGKDFLVRVELQNKGDTPASGLTFTNLFPANAQIKDYTGTWSTVQVTEHQYSFTLDVIDPGQRLVFDFTLRAPAGEFLVLSSAFAAESESVLWNNSFTFQVEIQPSTTLPPAITITSPADSVKIPYGSEVTFSAIASDVDGQVTRVLFAANNSAIGELDQPPYAFRWTPPSYGTYTISATAYDDLGSSASHVITVQVDDPPRNQILSFKFDASGYEIVVGAQPGRTCVLLFSDDLDHWEQVDTQIATEKTIQFNGDTSDRPARFYRVVD
jgi:hypothetical protein